MRSLKTLVILSGVILLLGSMSLAFAGDDDDAEKSAGHLKILKAQWDQKKQKLDVRAEEGSGGSTLIVYYGGNTYTMKYKEKKNRYELKVEPVCYASSISISSTSGETVTGNVKVKEGDGAGYECGDSGSGSDNGGGTGGGGSGVNRDVVVMATNDLGMHCTCPGASTFIVLPPFNTLRAQVFERVGENPKILSDPNDIRVEYSILENSDQALKGDPYFQNWIQYGPKLFPGFSFVRSDGRIQGLTGATLSGEMEAKGGWWEVVGVPAYPIEDPNGAQIDPLGGPNRNPYLTGVVRVFDQATNTLLAETTTTIPVAYGGCCGCHLSIAQDYGMQPTPEDSFKVMGMLHAQNGSGIDISKIDPDGDGVGGPIRCSQCHLDPAMGETQPPGYAGYPTSKYTFSEVVHRFHVESPQVAAYDPDIARNCYDCHPGNGVNCYRGHHKGKNLWCTDCHGDLNQRVAQGQLKAPWSPDTLPSCENCHTNTGEGGGWLGVFGGKYLNSKGHKGDKVLCSTCHGEPHALYPSTLAKDNEQPQALQGRSEAIGVCDVCHIGKDSNWRVPPHKGTPGYSGGGGTSVGTGGTIDAAQELDTTCLNCHGDRRNKVSCSNTKWLGHDGSKVSHEVFVAVSQYLTGSDCGTGSGTGTNPSGGDSDD